MTLLEEYCICTYCGKRRTDGIHKLCDVCIEKRKQYYRTHKAEQRARQDALRMRYRAEGRCEQCGRPAHGARLCLEHRLKHNQICARPRKRYREQGLCVWCGAIRVDGHMVCSECLEKARERCKKATEASVESRRRKREDREYERME